MTQLLPGLLPYVTTTELLRLYTHMTRFFSPTYFICSALRTMTALKEKMANVEWAVVLDAFEHVFRQEYRCGANYGRALPVSPDDGFSSTVDTLEDSEDVDAFDVVTLNSRRQRKKNQSRRINRSVMLTPMPRKAYSAFHVLNLLLTLEEQLAATSVAMQQQLRTMVKDFLETTANCKDDWDNPLPSPAISYLSHAGYWFALTLEQRQFLIASDPEMERCRNLRPAPYPVSPRIAPFTT